MNEWAKMNEDVIAASLKKMSNTIEACDPKRRSRKILDALHYWRIQYAASLFEISNKTRANLKEKLKETPTGPGVYLLLIVDPVGNVVLYPGSTGYRKGRGKSKTAGLNFRLNDHLRLLAKTPLTLFFPNWWIRKIFWISIEDRKEAKELEKRLWELAKSQSMSSFSSVLDLDRLVAEFMRKATSNELSSVELQPDLLPIMPFKVLAPPAGMIGKSVQRKDLS